MRGFVVHLPFIAIIVQASLRECVAFSLSEGPTSAIQQQRRRSHRRTPQCFAKSNDNDDHDIISENVSVSSQRRRALLSRITISTAIVGQAWCQSTSDNNNNMALALNVPDFPSFPEFPSLRSDGNGNKNGYSKKIGGLAAKIRGISRTMDELQRDLMQERWDLVVNYPAQLRSYVPLFTTYTDSAFPTDAPTDKGLRVALRYEVGRFFASLERLKQASTRKALEEAYVAYSDMSLHFDRYLHVGGLYTYYDDLISTEPFFKGIKDDELIYSDPIKDPAEVRDLVVLCQGPDKGKTGIVIGIYPDGRNYCVVKLDRIKGMREIKVVPRPWAAKRLGEQDPDDVFLIPRKGI